MSNESQKLNLKEIQHQVYRTDYIDGFPGIFLGIILLLLAFIINLGVIFLTVFLLFFVLSFPISELLRKHFTYPRLGYFKVKSDTPRQFFPGIFIFISVLIICSLVVISVLEGGTFTNIDDILWKYLPFSLGLAMLGLSIDITDKTGQKKYLGLGSLSLLAGFLFILINFQQLKDGITLYLLFLGSSNIVLGFVTFFQFLNEYPLIEEVADLAPEVIEYNGAE